MAELTEATIPRLTSGCRWGGTPEAPVVLIPGGSIQVEGSGRVILELCSGQFTVEEIIQKLQEQFVLAPRDKIRADVVTFLRQLHAEHIIEF